MKNCDEITNRLLERRDRYVAEQKKKRKRAAGTCLSLCCVCLIAFMGFGIRQGGWLSAGPEQTAEDVLYPGLEDTFDESKGVGTNNPEENDQIYIQTIEELPNAVRAMINLSGEDLVSMGRDEINGYYGVNIFPTVPGDLKEDGETKWGIFKRNQGTGELYWDSNGIRYSNEDSSKTVNVEVDKGCVPFDFCNLFDDIQSKSVINHVEVGIAQTAVGDYYAEFMYKDVGFRVTAGGLTQDEFVAVISSLLA